MSTSSTSYSDKLTELLKELKNYWLPEYITRSISVKEDARKDLYLPSDSASRLCLFLVPVDMMSYYEELVYPIVISYGFLPITTYDIVSPGENIYAKEMGLINKSDIIVIDLSSDYYNKFFLSYTLSKDVTLIPILVKGQHISNDIKRHKFIIRPKDIFDENEPFLEVMDSIFHKLSINYFDRLQNEPNRLLEYRLYRAAFISAIILLETSVRTFLQSKKLVESRQSTLYRMVDILSKSKELAKDEYTNLTKWIKTRNQILHNNEDISNRKAKKYTLEIMDFLSKYDLLEYS